VQKKGAGADSEEPEPSWKVQLGVCSDGDLWEAMDLLRERMEGKLEVHWVRDHEDKRMTRRMTSKHQRGNVKADANCTAVKRWARSKARLLLPRRKSWRLCYSQMAQVRTWLLEFQALGCCLRRAFWSEITFSSMGAAGLRSVLYVFQNEFSIQNRTHKMRIVISKCNFYMKQFQA
jgi:hypothetical protein